MVRALLINIHFVVIAKWEAEAIGKDIAESGYESGEIRFRAPAAATIGGGAKICIPFIHTTVSSASVHPRNTDVAITCRGNRREVMMRACWCGGYICFGTVGVAAIRGFGEEDSFWSFGRGAGIPQ